MNYLRKIVSFTLQRRSLSRRDWESRFDHGGMGTMREGTSGNLLNGDEFKT